MADFTGSKCAVCDEHFKDGDDIVVCPDCGTPYHRECWKKEGHCIKQELHGIEESVTEEVLPEADLRCPNCGALNLRGAFFCSSCGKPFNDENSGRIVIGGETEGMGPFNPLFALNFGDPLCGFPKEETFEDVSIADVADYVKTNKFYFLPQFKRFKETGRKISWNLSAMLFPSYYYAYRKMYGYMIIIAVMNFIFMLPNLIWYFSGDSMAASVFHEFASQFNVNGTNFQTLWDMAGWLSLIFQFMAGIFANWLYYRHTIRKIKSIRKKHEGFEEEGLETAEEEIKRKGGVNLPLTAVIFGLSMLFSAFIYYPMLMQMQ